MMRKKAICCLLLMSVLLISSCGENTGKNAESISPQALEYKASNNTSTKEPEGIKAPHEVTQLSAEEQYDKVVEYFSSKGIAGKSRQSFITEAEYFVGINKKKDRIQCMYASKDKSQGVLLSLDRDGRLEVLVNIKSGNEGVIGTAELNAAEYTYGYEFADFTYQSNQRDWDYEKFRRRANAYIQNTLIYADSMLMETLRIDLRDLGFTAWIDPGMYKEDFISANDVAGLWDYKSPDDNGSSKLYLTGNKVYWCGYKEAYADAITTLTMTESEDYLLSQDMMMSMTDPFTGEVVIIDNYKDDSTREQFRRYIYRNTDGTLCMRVESVYLGMSNHEDGKIYIKADDNEDASISPKIYYPSGMVDDDTDQDIQAQGKEGNDKDSLSPSASSTYQSIILDKYTDKMEYAVPGLVQEYRSETASITDINRLAEICNEKVGQLAEICNEGISEMAEVMYAKGDSYETYETWATKLMNNYTAIANEIQEAYLKSAL